MKLSTILSIIILCDIEHLKTTVIEPTSNEILFKPLGNLIPELSWATIRIHFNIAHMFAETDELRKASYLMYTEYNTIRRKYGTHAFPATQRQSHIDSIHSPHRTRNTIIKLCKKSVKFHRGSSQSHFSRTNSV